jgi:hypothetical protein
MSNPCSCGVKIADVKKGSLKDAINSFIGSDLETNMEGEVGYLTFRFPGWPPSETCKNVSREFECNVEIDYSNYASGYEGSEVYEMGITISEVYNRYECDYDMHDCGYCDEDFSYKEESEAPF